MFHDLQGGKGHRCALLVLLGSQRPRPRGPTRAVRTDLTQTFVMRRRTGSRVPSPAATAGDADAGRSISSPILRRARTIGALWPPYAKAKGGHASKSKNGLNDAKLERNYAAVKLQSAYRGLRHRSKMASEFSARAVTSGIHGLQHLHSSLGTYSQNTQMLALDAAVKLQSVARGRIERKRDRTADDASVQADTPADSWFTPRAGWPEHLVEKQWGWKEPPQLLMPTAAQAPVLFEQESDDIGVLRVEVLEAEGLPRMDTIGSCDPYAIVIFEGTCARTNTWRNTRRPRWPSDSPRAFLLPIKNPYSNLYVGLKDHDDFRDIGENIGRCVLEIASLHARTLYDCWLPLSLKNVRPPGSARGAIRLRYSMECHSDRQRLIRYVLPLQAPMFYIPFASKTAMADARFVLQGTGVSEPGWHEGGYHFDTLRSHYDEIFEVIDEFKEQFSSSVSSLLFYHDARSALISIGCGIWWQALVSYPHYAFASMPLLLLVLLTDRRCSTYDDEHGSKYPIQKKPSFFQLVTLLFLPHAARPSPLTADPVPYKEGEAVPSNSEPRRSQVHVSEWWRGQKAVSEARKKAEAKLGYSEFDFRPRFDESAVDEFELSARSESGAEADGTEGAKRFLADLKLIEQEVAEHFEYYFLGSTEGTALIDEKHLGLIGSRRSVFDRINPVAAPINPLNPYLQWVQHWLGALVLPLRSYRRVMNWEDRILTTWVALGLLALTIIFALIPWNIVLNGLLRLLGAALFGPHMYWVGRQLGQQRAQEEEWSREYRNADKAGRKAILQRHRARLMDEHQARLDATREKTVGHHRALLDYFNDAPYVGVVESLRTSSRFKYCWLPDPHRSRAFPVTTSHHRIYYFQ